MLIAVISAAAAHNTAKLNSNTQSTNSTIHSTHYNQYLCNFTISVTPCLPILAGLDENRNSCQSTGGFASPYFVIVSLLAVID